MHVRMLCHGPGRNEKAGAGLYGPGKGRHTGGIKDSNRREKGRTDEADVHGPGTDVPCQRVWKKGEQRIQH